MEFLNLRKFIPDIYFDIRYATTNNFIGRKIYQNDSCLLRSGTAVKLFKVQSVLRELGLSLKIFDAYRPPSVQKIFWDFLPDERYIAHPLKGSKHSRGAAVDVTLVDHKGIEFEMPTSFDEFTEKAHRSYNDLPEKIIKNRQFLEQIMEKGNTRCRLLVAGFWDAG